MKIPIPYPCPEKELIKAIIKAQKWYRKYLGREPRQCEIRELLEYPNGKRISRAKICTTIKLINPK